MRVPNTDCLGHCRERSSTRRLATHLPRPEFWCSGRCSAWPAIRYYEALDWRDAFLNAAMLLGGEGPVDKPQTPGGKLFAGLYALYAGLAFLIVAAILFAPIVHRLMHRFHWDDNAT